MRNLKVNEKTVKTWGSFLNLFACKECYMECYTLTLYMRSIMNPDIRLALKKGLRIM